MTPILRVNSCCHIKLHITPPMTPSEHHSTSLLSPAQSRAESDPGTSPWSPTLSLGGSWDLLLPPPMVQHIPSTPELLHSAQHEPLPFMSSLEVPPEIVYLVCLVSSLWGCSLSPGVDLLLQKGHWDGEAQIHSGNLLWCWCTRPGLQQ